MRCRCLACAAIAAFLQLAAPDARSAPSDELKELRASIASLRRELAAAEESKGEAADALRDSERAISEANRRLYELNGKLRRLSDELAALSERSRGIKEGIQSQKETLSRLLHGMYVSGRGETLALALSGKAPGDIARNLRYLGYVARTRADLLADLQARLAALDLLAAETRDKQQAIAEAQAEQLQERAELAKKNATRAEVLNRVAREVARQRSQLGTLKRDEARLANLVDRLSRLLARQAPPQPGTPRAAPMPGDKEPVLAAGSGRFRQLKGHLPLPVRGEVANRFGNPRSDTGLQWRGLFIRAPEGDSVRAVAAGRVVFADWLRGFGNLLIVDHGDGYMSLYGNNESLYKQVGEAIGGGDAIATVGSSGGSPESGLYFELRYQGKAMDPLQWVSLR